MWADNFLNFFIMNYTKLTTYTLAMKRLQVTKALHNA